MRGNLKSIPEEPQYVEAKLSCTEFQEAKKVLFQVKTFVTSFGSCIKLVDSQMNIHSRVSWDVL